MKVFVRLPLWSIFLDMQQSFLNDHDKYFLFVTLWITTDLGPYSYYSLYVGQLFP